MKKKNDLYSVFPVSLLAEEGIRRDLAGLEVDVDDFDSIVSDKLIPLLKANNINIEECEVPVLNQGNQYQNKKNDCLSSILDNAFEFLNIYSGTLPPSYFNEHFLQLFKKSYKEGERKLGKSPKIKVYAGPYVDLGQENPFLLELKALQSAGWDVEFFYSKQRLPVHGFLTESAFIFEDIHAEFFKTRKRWLVKGGANLMYSIGNILDVKQGELAEKYCLGGKNGYEKVSALSDEGMADFKSPVKVKSIDELFTDEFIDKSIADSLSKINL